MPEREKPAPDVWTWLVEIAVAVFAFLLVISLLGVYIGSGYEAYRSFIERIYDFWLAIRPVIILITTLFTLGLIGFMTTTYRKFRALEAEHPLMADASKDAAAPVSQAMPIAKQAADEWQEIEKMMQSDNVSDWNMAVLRADVLLDDVLQRMNHEGETVKERLDKVDPTMLPSLERLYSAHRLRNMIAHDPSIPHTRETVRHALGAYERGLKELGVLKTE